MNEHKPCQIYPIAEPDIGELEVSFVTEAVRSGWVSSLGPYVSEFERKFAGFCNTRFGVATCNGTAALHLALRCLGVGPGDEVIVPSLTFVATANAVVYTAAKPILVDVDPKTWCLDPHLIRRKLSPSTRAIIVVHLYGQPVDMDPILSLASEHNIAVVEDAAHAHGALYKGRVVGGLATVGIFSFYGNKLITTGEGGILVTNDPALQQKARFLRDHAMTQDRRYWHPEIGFNYRMTNLQAALGLAQLRRIREFLNKKAAIMTWYREFLDGEDLTLNPSMPWSNGSNWLICAILPRKMSVAAVMKGLRSQGVDSRPFFQPMHTLPHLKALSGASCTLPVSEDLAARGLSLPSSTKLARDDVSYIAGVFKRVLGKQRSTS